jgi:hypothetical protein
MSQANTAIFNCAFCKSDIETDSFFCDQCGKEIFLCEKCLQPGRDGFCEEDGEPLVAAKILKPVSTVAQTPVQHVPATGATQRFDNPLPTPSLGMALKLVNANLGISIDIQHDAIFGRTTGPYVSQLGTLMTISGKHLLFRYDVLKGWTFQDIGSTHGTRYSKSNKAWENEPKVTPSMPVTLEDKTYLLVANVEFAVQIEGTASASTQRI